MERRQNSYRRGYNGAWTAIAKQCVAIALREQMVCHQCHIRLREGDAIDIDHIVPIREDPSRRFDPTNMRPMHHRCHSQHTQGVKPLGYSTRCGADGYPVDSKHPANGGTPGGGGVSSS
jgi:5-methylcytosine-specific restriction protein A